MAKRANAQPLETVSRPKQARSERTLQRILVAAEELIGEKGLADASIPEIVRRAGSSVGGFYARFKDKNELLRALEERFFQEMSGTVDAMANAERWKDATLVQVVEAWAEELVRIGREHRNLIAAFLHRGAGHADALVEAVKFRTSVSDRVTAMVMSRPESLSHPRPQVGVDLAVQFAFALMLQLVMMGEIRAGGHVLTDRELCDEMARNFLNYIGAPNADLGGASTTSPAEPSYG